MTALNVGVIGIGAFGSRVALRLLWNGHHALQLYDVDDVSTRQFTNDYGGLITGSPKMMAQSCDAVITAIRLDAHGVPLSMGRTRRIVAPAQWLALVARDKGCVFPGCDRPARWSDGHHLRHWIDGGPTSLVNLALLCRRCHRRVHEGGWQFVRDSDGRVRAIPP